MKIEYLRSYLKHLNIFRKGLEQLSLQFVALVTNFLAFKVKPTHPDVFFAEEFWYWKINIPSFVFPMADKNIFFQDTLQVDEGYNAISATELSRALSNKAVSPDKSCEKGNKLLSLLWWRPEHFSNTLRGQRHLTEN